MNLDRYYYERKSVKEYIPMGGDSFHVKEKTQWGIFDRLNSSAVPIAYAQDIFYAELIVKSLKNSLHR